MEQAKKTEKKMARERRNVAIRKERAELLSVEGAMPTAVDEYLGVKYGVARITVYKICK